MTAAQQALASLKTDGVHLSLPELIRYQQLTRLLNQKPMSPPRATMSGGYLSRQKGRGMEFDEARHYLPGDDIRAIDWRGTARTGKTHTKIYREERERPVFILCDLTASMQFGSQLLLKSVQAAHIAALLSWAAAARGDKVGALIFNDGMHRECKPLSRQRAVLSMCHELIRVQSSPAANHNSGAFTDACMRLRRLAKPGSLVYLISDFESLQQSAEQPLSHIARHCDVQAIRVDDPMDFSLPDVAIAQQVSVTDGFTDQSWLLGDKSLNKRYSQWRDSVSVNIEKTFKSKLVKYSRISAGLPLDQQMEALGGRR